MDDQLRRRSVGAPAARSLLLTILGEYVLPRGEPVWQETLVGALVSVGYTQQAARQALARSVRDGWLETSRHGRRARVSLSSGTAELLRTGASRIYSFGSPWEWDGRWLVLVLRVPEERREVRHQLRTRLAWAGLGSMGAGVWLTPHVEREAELARDDPRGAGRRSHLVRGFARRARARSCGRCGDRLGSRLGARARTRRSSRISWGFGPRVGEASFRMQTLLVHAWRKFPFLDPDLPVGAAARRLAAPAGLRAVRGAPRAVAGRGPVVFRRARGGPHRRSRVGPAGAAPDDAWRITRTISELSAKRSPAAAAAAAYAAAAARGPADPRTPRPPPTPRPAFGKKPRLFRSFFPNGCEHPEMNRKFSFSARGSWESHYRPSITTGARVQQHHSDADGDRQRRQPRRQLAKTQTWVQCPVTGSRRRNDEQASASSR